MVWPPTVAPLNVVHVCSEVSPWSKTGGLADVAGSLPPALSEVGVNAAVITPCYRDIPANSYERTDIVVPVTVGGRTSEVRVCRSELAGQGGLVPVYLLECAEAYDRPGLYGPGGGADYPDNAWRYALLCEAAFVLSRRLRLHPDIIHCHDWQTGLLPLHCKDRLGGWVRTVFTIHNLAYQGTFPADTIEELGLQRSHFHPEGMEFWGWLSFLKAGINFADKVTTVSPRYAEEITTPTYGQGLDGVLRKRADDLVGILNGIGVGEHDPTSAELPDTISATDPAGKLACRAALAEAFRLDTSEETPILGVVSRLVSQKGIDLIPPALEPLLAEGAIRLVVLGTGEPALEKALADFGARWPGRVGVELRYDAGLGRLLLAGSDALLVPSRFEPCGLTQLFAMRYGTVPVVRATGGLADTVTDEITGFVFPDASAPSLRGALGRLLAAWTDGDSWRKMRRAAMAEDFSWSRSAQAYAELYEEVHRAD